MPDTLDLAELARQSVNVLVGNVEPHAQAFDFGVNPPRVTAGGAVLQKHLRFLPMLRAVCGSEQGLDIEARLMKSQPVAAKIISTFGDVQLAGQPAVLGTAVVEGTKLQTAANSSAA